MAVLLALAPGAEADTPPPNRIVDVAASLDAVCLLSLRGNVHCTGDDPLFDGWLRLEGLGKDDPRALDISLEHYRLCAIRDDDTVRCWQSEGPVDPLVSLRDEKPAQIESGREHTCARFESGRVACWGEGTSGQLGNVKTDSVDQAALVEDLDDAVELALGARHSCARRRGGTVVCWGQGSSAQITGRFSKDRSHFVKVPGIDDAIEVGSGPRANQTCAVRESGAVQCWGTWGTDYDGGGRIGHGPVDLPAVPDVIEVVMHETRICGRKHDGAVVCWDAVDEPRLGHVYAPAETAFWGRKANGLSAGAFTLHAHEDERVRVEGFLRGLGDHNAVIPLSH